MTVSCFNFPCTCQLRWFCEISCIGLKLSVRNYQHLHNHPRLPHSSSLSFFSPVSSLVYAFSWLNVGRITLWIMHCDHNYGSWYLFMADLWYKHFEPSLPLHYRKIFHVFWLEIWSTRKQKKNIRRKIFTWDFPTNTVVIHVLWVKWVYISF